MTTAVELLEEALHLRMNGERAPGGNESWDEWDCKAEAFLRTDIVTLNLETSAAGYPAGNIAEPETSHLRPAYYRGAGGMTPFDIIDAFRLDFYEGNAVKCIIRWRKKGGVEDLRKARVYLGEAIKRAGEET